MSIAVNVDARVKTVTVTDDLITFHLVDGRVISVPLVWSWRLNDATPIQRNNYEIIGDVTHAREIASQPRRLPDWV